MRHLVHVFGSVVDPWGYPLVFLAAASEAALFIGLVFPGESILLVGGFLAWQGRANLWLLILAAIAGAAVGDSIGYELGRRLGDRMRRSRLGRRLGEERWERGARYLRERGGKAVFGARFVSVVKTIVPAMAGQARMPYRTFLSWNLAGAVVWGTLHVGLGYVAGRSWSTVERYVGRAGLLLFALVVLVGLLVHLVRKRRRQPADDQLST